MLGVLYLNGQGVHQSMPTLFFGSASPLIKDLVMGVPSRADVRQGEA